LVQKLIVLNRHHPMAEGEISFGRFRLDSARREPRRGNEPVQLEAGRSTFSASWRRPEGTVVSKDELMARLWGGVVVEENNLQVDISALRKVLFEDGGRERWIVTVPGARLPAPRSAETGYCRRPPLPRDVCRLRRSRLSRYCRSTI